MSDHEDDRLIDTPESSERVYEHLEVEQLLSEVSPGGRATRTYSGSLLLSRGSRRNPPEERHSWSNEVICEGKGRKLAKAALSSGKLAANRVFRGSRSPISCWLASLLAMVFFSVFFNGFEGHYFSGFFGDQRSTQDKTSFQPNLMTGRVFNNNYTERPIEIATTTPTKDLSLSKTRTIAPKQLPASSFLSVQNHKSVSTGGDSSKTSLNNSFSTWLDFDERDPPPSEKQVSPSDPKKFVETWCLLDKSVEWNPRDSWHHRAPAFLLPGASHAGIQFLTESLHDHPSVIKTTTKQIHFFVDRPFERFVSSGKTLVKKARDAMYLRHYALTELKRNESLVAFDASPGYLYYSSQVPLRLLCVIPWVKLVIILRNPVDRVLEHYAAECERGLKLSLEDWINKDMALMKEVNLISSNSTISNMDEDVAWLLYQKKSVAGQIGRSLYVIQIRQWIQAFLRAGRNPDIILLRTDHLALNPNGQYQRILNFVGLAPMHLQRETLPIEITHQTRPIANDTRFFLEAFFRPYNRKLKALIRRYNISIG